MPNAHQVRARFYRPPVSLRRYISTFYLIELQVPDGGSISDYRYPQWGNFLFHAGCHLKLENSSGVILQGQDFVVMGPNHRTMNFEIGSGRVWGVGLMPLGWAKFVPAPAVDFADALVDGAQHPSFADFSQLAGTVFGAMPDVEAELARISACFLALVDGDVPDEGRITAIHAALFDEDVSTVSALARYANVSPRTAERVCDRAFGFSPKLLLRRQRFMRSLAKFMLHPARSWIDALDSQYYDQAQFVREFREFMGMTPRAYARMDHPVADAFITERTRMAWAVMQALDGPDGAGAVGEQLCPDTVD